MPKTTIPMLECVHADTCLSSYWQGDSRAHVQIMVWPKMSLKEIKQQIHHELNVGFVDGNEPLTRDDSGEQGDKWYAKAHAAVNRIKPATKGQRSFFKDVPAVEDGEAVYAYFVFNPMN